MTKEAYELLLKQIADIGTLLTRNFQEDIEYVLTLCFEEDLKAFLTSLKGMELSEAYLSLLQSDGINTTVNDLISRIEDRHHNALREYKTHLKNVSDTLSRATNNYKLAYEIAYEIDQLSDLNTFEDIGNSLIKLLKNA